MRPLLLVIATLVASVAPARAAAPPRGGVLVVAAADGASELRARDEAAGLCLTLKSRNGSGSSCGDPTLRDDQAAVLTYDGVSFGGAVPAAVATVELTRSDGTVVRATPVAGEAYRGRLRGRVRFFTVLAPPVTSRVAAEDDTEVEARLLDAAGTVVGVFAERSDDGQPTGPATSGRERVRGATVEFTVRPVSQLTPTAADLEHRSPAACLTLSVRQGRNTSTTGQCYSEGDGDEEALAGISACSPPVDVLAGLVPRGATSVTAIFGDGTRRRARTIALGAGFPGRRAFLVTLTGDRALRRLEAAGRRFGPSLPPPAAGCRSTSGGGGSSSVGGPPAPQSAAPGGPSATLSSPPATLLAVDGHRLIVADGPSGRLCVAVDREALREGDCGLLRRSPGSLLVRRRTEPGGATFLAGVAPAGAAGVSVATAGGQIFKAVLRDAAPGYAGAYAGRLRPFSVRIPAGRLPVVASVVTPAGRQVAGSDATPLVSFDEITPRVEARRVGRLGPGAVAWAVALRDGRRVVRCAAVTPGRKPRFADVFCGAVGGDAAAQITVGCTPRQIGVSAVLPGRASRLEARTADGRVLRATSVAIGGGQRLHRSVVPRSSGLASVTTRRAGRRLVVRALKLPAAARQCGYTLQTR